MAPSPFKGSIISLGQGAEILFKFDLISLQFASVGAFSLCSCRCFHLYTFVLFPPFQSGTSPLMSTLCSSSRTFQECVHSICAVPVFSSPTWPPLRLSAQFRRYCDLIFHKYSFISPYSACCHSYRRLRSSVIGWF